MSRTGDKLLHVLAINQQSIDHGGPEHEIAGPDFFLRLVLAHRFAMAYALAYAQEWSRKMPATGKVRHVRLFKNGRSQAVRIPREFELPGNEAILRREESGRLILESLSRPNLVELLSMWTPLSKKDQLPVIEVRPARPVEI
jgi:antitoxin VapB